MNKPLPFTQASKLSQLSAGTNIGFSISFNAGFAMALVTAMFVMFYIKERMTRAKLLQFVSGVNKVVFWMTSFVIDYLLFLLIAIVFLGVLAAYQKDGYSTPAEIARNFEILALFGFAALPFTYIFSLIFNIPSSGLTRLIMIYVVSGVVFFLAYFILNNEALKLQYIAKPLGWVFLIFPHYSMSRGMSNLYMKQSMINICETQCSYYKECSDFGVQAICDVVPINCSGDSTDPVTALICNLKNSCCNRDFYGFDENGIGMNLVALAIIGVVSFIVLFAIEYRWLQNLYFVIKKPRR